MKLSSLAAVFERLKTVKLKAEAVVASSEDWESRSALLEELGEGTPASL